MTMRNLIGAAAALALAGCGGGGDSGNDAALTGNEILPVPAGEAGADLNGMGNNAASVPTSAQDYIRVASAGDLFEIESSRLAQEKARNEPVREFAQILINEHSRSTEQLRTAASQAQPTLEVPTPQLNPQQQQMIAGLRAADPTAFDQLYLQQQLQAHQETLSALLGYAQSGEVASLRQHAATAAGSVQQHLSRVRALATQPQ